MTRVLSLDDEPEMGSLIRLVVERRGYNLWTTSDSYEAWGLLHTLPFDLLMQDTMRPDVLGLDFLRLMQADEDLADVPVLVVSAYAWREDTAERWGLESGPDAYLSKPFGPQEMLTAMRDVLRRRDRPVPPEDERIKGLSSLDQCIAALRSADSERRRAALARWGWDKDKEKWPIEPPIQALGDAEMSVRLVAVWALQRLEDARAVEPLAALLDDDELEVRLAAIQTMGLLGYRQAADALIGHTDDADVRWAVLLALGRLGAAQAVEPATEALRDESAWMRTLAARTLGYLKESRSVAPLIDRLADGDAMVHMAAIQALGEIGDERAIPALERTVREGAGEPERPTTHAARLAIQKIQDAHTTQA